MNEVKTLTLALDPEEQVRQFVIERFEEPDSSGHFSAFAGVYLICVTERIGFRGGRPRYTPERVMYVGSSKNIRKRFNSPDHPLHILQAKHPWPDCVYARSLRCDDFLKKEVQLIRLFNPPMNIHHNG